MHMLLQPLLVLALAMPNKAVSRVFRRAPVAGTPYRQRLENYMNMQYHGKISIGGQVVPAIFDTGSFELIVTSTRCKQCRKPAYNPMVSKTFQPSKPVRAVEHLFGSGPVNSELGYEDVKLGP